MADSRNACLWNQMFDRRCGLFQVSTNRTARLRPQPDQIYI